MSRQGNNGEKLGKHAGRAFLSRAVKQALMGGVAIGVLGLAGCDGLSTQLSVREYLPLLVKKGQNFLQPGNYKAKLEVKKEKKVEYLRLEVDTPGKKTNPVVIIPLLATQRVPTSGGELHISAAQSGQIFDLHTIVTHDVDESEERWGRESCSREGRITECSRDENGVRTCKTRTVSVSGSRDVRGYDRITTNDYDISLTAPADQHVIATASAVDADSKHIETFRGDCVVKADLDVYIDRGGPTGPRRDGNGDTARDNREQERERTDRDRDRQRDERRDDRGGASERGNGNASGDRGNAGGRDDGGDRGNTGGRGNSDRNNQGGRNENGDRQGDNGDERPRDGQPRSVVLE